jgi:hypothetical protein
LNPGPADYEAGVLNHLTKFSVQISLKKYESKTGRDIMIMYGNKRLTDDATSNALFINQ